MRLLRSLCMAVLCLIALAGIVSAQISAPVPTTFRIAEYNAENITGDMMNWATLERSISMDTLPEIILSITAMNTDTTALIIDVSYIIDNGFKQNYKDTIQIWEQQFFPDRPAGTVVCSDCLPDSVFSVVFNNQSVSTGDKFSLFIRKGIQKAQYQPRLTLISTDGDTVLSSNDTVWSRAMPWDDYITLYLKGTASSDDDIKATVAYQLKMNYFGDWAGDINPNGLVVVIDTLAMLTTQTAAIQVLKWHPYSSCKGIIPMADSIRFQILGRTGTTKWYVNFLTALWEE